MTGMEDLKFKVVEKREYVRDDEPVVAFSFERLTSDWIDPPEGTTPDDEDWIEPGEVWGTDTVLGTMELVLTSDHRDDFEVGGIYDFSPSPSEPLERVV